MSRRRWTISGAGRVRRGVLPDHYLLSQNRELRDDGGIYNWSLPAWATRLSDGRVVNVCPAAGACVKLCYARQGTYRFPAVHAAHVRNLELVLDRPDEWERRMIAELWNRTRYYEQAVRIHDSGDFFSDDYLLAWLRIMRACPRNFFYAYTKEVDRFRRLVEPDPPQNFRWVYSLGGREDHLIDRDRDRHADVFPDAESLQAAGYVSQENNDLLAVTLPTTRIGIIANRIPALLKRQGGETFSGIEQRQRRAKRPVRS